MPLHICKMPGCNRTSPEGERHCERHKEKGAEAEKDRARRKEQRRGSSTERGYDWDWQQCREAYLKANPVCHDCEEEGIPQLAEEVHHIVKIADDPSKRLDPDNLMGLCKPCHAARTARGE